MSLLVMKIVTYVSKLDESSSLVGCPHRLPAISIQKYSVPRARVMTRQPEYSAT
jgi:hypothetical protein